MTQAAGKVWGMVDQIIWPILLWPMIKEFDAQITINGKYPIAHFMNLI
jgi:hypothetical protein